MLVNFHVNVCDDRGKNEVDNAFSHRNADIKTTGKVLARPSIMSGWSARNVREKFFVVINSDCNG